MSTARVTGSRKVPPGTLETGAPVECPVGCDGVAVIVPGRALRRTAVAVVLEIAIVTTTAMRPTARSSGPTMWRGYTRRGRHEAIGC